jgi:hypothetical protein
VAASGEGVVGGGGWRARGEDLGGDEPRPQDPALGILVVMAGGDAGRVGPRPDEQEPIAPGRQIGQGLDLSGRGADCDAM